MAGMVVAEDADDSAVALEQRRRAARERWSIRAVRTAVIVGFLLVWQFAPEIPFLRSVIPFLNPFFISSPLRTTVEMWDLAIGSPTTGSIWPDFLATTISSILGTAIGTVLGLLVALILSYSQYLTKVMQPIIVTLNAIPRIAFVPVIVIIAGPTTTSSAITAATIVFFVVFFNAFEGSRNMPASMTQNAALLGASRFSTVVRVRFPYAAAWTFASLPAAIGFGLVGAVTTEVLTGAQGIGRLMVNALNTANSDLTFATAVYVGILGVLLVQLSTLARTKYLHWWDEGNS